jgi:hypothetical protein
MMMMKKKKISFLPLFGLLMSSSASGYNTNLTYNESENSTLVAMEQVPGVSGYVQWNDEPPLVVKSTTSVTIMRYNDDGNFFLEGGQPISATDMYILVKSSGDCTGTNLTPIIEYEQLERTTDWNETYNYTGSISISFEEDLEDIATTKFVRPPSSFKATWDYTSFGCSKIQADKSNSSDTITENISKTKSPTPPPSSLDSDTTTEGISKTKPPTLPPSSLLATGKEAASSLTAGSSSSTTTTRTGSFMVTIMAAILAVLMLGDRGHHNHRSIVLGTTAVVMVFGFVWIGTTTTTTKSNTSIVTTTAPHNDHHPFVPNAIRQQQQQQQQQKRRQLQDGVAADRCTVAVEILLDGCRRASNTNNTDLFVVAPAIRVMGKIA